MFIINAIMRMLQMFYFMDDEQTQSQTQLNPAFLLVRFVPFSTFSVNVFIVLFSMGLCSKGESKKMHG